MTDAAKLPKRNKTGVMNSVEQAKQMIAAAGQAEPSSSDISMVLRTRRRYIEGATPVGTLPASAPDGGPDILVLLDKLGERLAFERTGVRLYEAVITKFDIEGGFSGGPSRLDLDRIRVEELDHFLLLEDTIRKLGGDPTGVTPSANLVATESMGLSAVVADPRTTLPQCLHAILVAELADDAGWEQLVGLCRDIGRTELAETFEACLVQESQHVDSVRAWLSAHADGEVGVAAAQ
jgi:hypothetical protein